MRNELVGVIFADGEIISNLLWTQKIYDLMQQKGKINPPDPLNEDDVLEAATQAIQALMSEEYISHTNFIGASFTQLLSEVKSITSNETRLQAMLSQANAESSVYAQTWVLKSGKKDTKKDTKANKKAVAATE